MIDTNGLNCFGGRLAKKRSLVVAASAAVLLSPLRPLV